jgi:hypothetical protein
MDALPPINIVAVANASSSSSGAAAPRPGPADALAERRAPCRNDRERAPDLWGVQSLRAPRRSLSASQSVGRARTSPLGSARRLARRRAQLALRPGLAVCRHRPRLSGLSRALRRVAVAPVPAPRPAVRVADAALLPAATEGAPAQESTTHSRSWHTPVSCYSGSSPR